MTDAKERIDLMAREGVRVASFALAPKKDLIARCKDHGMVVMPSIGNANYSVRLVDSAGNPLPQFYGIDLGVGSLTGTGNPGDEGVGFGVRISIVRVAKDNTYATVHVVPAD